MKPTKRDLEKAKTIALGMPFIQAKTQYKYLLKIIAQALADRTEECAKISPSDKVAELEGALKLAKEALKPFSGQFDDSVTRHTIIGDSGGEMFRKADEALLAIQKAVGV